MLQQSSAHHQEELIVHMPLLPSSQLHYYTLHPVRQIALLTGKNE